MTEPKREAINLVEDEQRLVALERTEMVVVALVESPLLDPQALKCELVFGPRDLAHLLHG